MIVGLSRAQWTDSRSIRTLLEEQLYARQNVRPNLFMSMACLMAERAVRAGRDPHRDPVHIPLSGIEPR